MNDVSCALLVNPHSGGGVEPALLEGLQQALAPSGATMVVTNSSQEASEFVLAAQSQGFTRIIVSGGDDSVRDVLPALLRTTCELGIVPRGTFNNLALALGLSLDPLMALEQALTGRARPMDLGQVAGLIFTESAGVGYLAEAWNRAPQPEPTGFMRFATGLLAAGSALADYQPLQLTIRIDGVETREEIWDLTVANAPMFANNIAIAPKASLDDGLLDVTIWPAMSRLEFLTSLPMVLSKDGPAQIPSVRAVQARVVEILSDVEIPLRVDNTVAHGQEFRFEILPRPLLVVRP